MKSKIILLILLFIPVIGFAAPVKKPVVKKGSTKLVPVKKAFLKKAVVKKVVPKKAIPKKAIQKPVVKKVVPKKIVQPAKVIAKPVVQQIIKKPVVVQQIAAGNAQKVILAKGLFNTIIAAADKLAIPLLKQFGGQYAALITPQMCKQLIAMLNQPATKKEAICILMVFQPEFINFMDKEFTVAQLKDITAILNNKSIVNKVAQALQSSKNIDQFQQVFKNLLTCSERIQCFSLAMMFKCNSGRRKALAKAIWRRNQNVYMQAIDALMELADKASQ